MNEWNIPTTSAPKKVQSRFALIESTACAVTMMAVSVYVRRFHRESVIPSTGVPKDVSDSLKLRLIPSLEEHSRSPTSFAARPERRRRAP